MKVLVMSDTHVAGHDFIIHAGDWDTCDIYNEVSRWLPVYGVTGNMDGRELALDLPEQNRFTLASRKIVLQHDIGSIDVFLKQRECRIIDIMIFGHTHVPFVRHYGKTLVLNPGAVSHPRQGYAPSVMSLTVDQEPTVEIISL